MTFCLVSMPSAVKNCLAEGAPARPRLAAYDLPGRGKPAVIVAHDDLSLGMLGVRHWEISGYSVDAARRIVLHLLLTADRRNSQPR